MFRHLAFACLLLVLPVTGYAADPPLTKDQREDLLKKIAADKEFADAVRGSERVVVASVSTYARKADKNVTAADFAEVMHFNYKTGQTIRTRYNRTENRVVRVEKLDAYPTPLADEELAEAKEIAKKESRPLAAFLDKHGADVTAGHLVPVIADRENPLYGKRLVTLVYRTKIDPKQPNRGASLNVEVNLTDRKLVQK